MIADLASQYAGKRILIAGASGFLGRHLLDWLAKYNCCITGVSRHHRVDDRPNVRWTQANLTNPVLAKKVFLDTRPDIAFHLTSESSGDGSLANVLPCFKNDLEATLNCLIAARETDVTRFVMTGSLEEPVLPQDGNDPDPIPSTPYAAAKFAGVIYGKMFHQLYKLPVVFLRPFMTYGPGQKESKVIPYAILSLLDGKPPQLSSGDRLVDWIYVSDVIEAIVRSGIAPDAPGEMLELGSQRAVSLGEVVNQIHGLIGGPLPVFGKISGWGESRRVADVRKASLVLGWKPTVTLDDGLRQTIEWYRETALRRACSEN